MRVLYRIITNGKKFRVQFKQVGWWNTWHDSHSSFSDLEAGITTQQLAQDYIDSRSDSGIWKEVPHATLP